MTMILAHLYPFRMNIYGDAGNVIAPGAGRSGGGSRCGVVPVNEGDAFWTSRKQTSWLPAAARTRRNQRSPVTSLSGETRSIVRYSPEWSSHRVRHLPIVREAVRHRRRKRDSRHRGVRRRDHRRRDADDRQCGGRFEVGRSRRFREPQRSHGSGRRASPAGGRCAADTATTTRPLRRERSWRTASAPTSTVPVLPKNPAFADELIRRALSRRGGDPVELKPSTTASSCELPQLRRRGPERKHVRSRSGGERDHVGPVDGDGELETFDDERRR